MPLSEDAGTPPPEDPQGGRDLVGYGRVPPVADWPGGARVAVNIVVNIEEGAEYSPLLGDSRHETILSDLAPFAATAGERHPVMESLYAYGARAGIWRVLRALQARAVPFTANAVGLALDLNPDIGAALRAADCDVLAHGWRWIDYAEVDAETERDHIARTVEAIERHTGRRPIGWYTGRPSRNTRNLVVEEGGFLYDSDAYDDDLPYWARVSGKAHLIVPYAFDTNDSRFARNQGFETASDAFDYWRDAFDCLHAEGAERPRMMTVGLHPRLVGRPGRIAALERFLDHCLSRGGVWFAKRNDIARHWADRHRPA